MPDYVNDCAHGGTFGNEGEDCADCGHDQSYHRRGEHACYWMQGFDGPPCRCMGFKRTEREVLKKSRIARLLCIRGPNP